MDREELGLTNITIKKGPKIHIELKRNFFRQIYFAKLDLKENEFIPLEKELEKVKWFEPEEIKQKYSKNPHNFQKSFHLIWKAVTDEDLS